MKSKIPNLLPLLLPLTLAFVLTDCAAQPALDKEVKPDEVMKPGDIKPGEWKEDRMPNDLSQCPDDTKRKIRGSSVVLVTYGDSSLNVTPVTKVKKKNDKGVGAIEFILIPTGISEDGKVTITGTNGPEGADYSWLKGGNGEVRTRVSSVVCLKDDTPPGSYKYKVEVEGVGTLDPRADVEE